MCNVVGAATPTQKLNNSSESQIFTIFAPSFHKFLHPQSKSTPLGFALAPA
jgi:hypothetical protein